MPEVWRNRKSMKIAVDFDGTITAHPKKLTVMMEALTYLHDVLILTACAGEFPIDQRLEEAKRRVREYDLQAFRVVWCETSEKIDYCVAHQVDILIDDVPFKDTKGVLQLIPNNITNIQGIV